MVGRVARKRTKKGVGPSGRVVRIADLLEHAEDARQRVLDRLEVGGRNEVVERQVAHERVVVVGHVQALLQARVRVEGGGRVEALGVIQHVQRQAHALALSLLVDLVESVLEVQPEGDLLHRSARIGIAVHARDLLNVRGPSVDARLERVQETRVRRVRSEVGDVGLGSAFARPLHRLKDLRMDDEFDVRNVDVLPQVEKGDLHVVEALFDGRHEFVAFVLVAALIADNRLEEGRQHLADVRADRAVRIAAVQPEKTT